MNQSQVQDVINFLFPSGTRGNKGEISSPPIWPPDLFGVAAHFAAITDCYTELLSFNESNGIGFKIHSIHSTLIAAGEDLSESVEFEACLEQTLDLIESTWAVLCNGILPEGTSDSWKLAVLKLLILADVACDGMGFYDPRLSPTESSDTGYRLKGWIPQVYSWMSNPDFYAKIVLDVSADDSQWYWNIKELVSQSTIDTDNAFEKYSAASACILIDSSRLCVLPKALTPRVGCTIRSLTENLSVHPGTGQVESKWFNHKFDAGFNEKVLNILIVPYPFSVSSSDFQGSSTHIPTVNSFSVNPTWLSEAPNIVELVKSLFMEAKVEGREIDVVILPELALNENTYLDIANMLASLSNGFMMLVAGVGTQGSHDYHINTSFTAYIEGGKIQGYNIQKKHHRWKLDKDQVKTYGLTGRLKPDLDWWEDTYVTGRTVDYHVFQKGACFATLICEDLARQDPCKPSIQSVGPNIIFALLMDSPQLKNRWPGRYTLGLIEDPGASLLTVTSLGLVTRSNWLHNGSRQTIALWGDQKGITEIDLPIGYHGVLLVLANVEKPLYTLDNRSGNGQFWELESLLPLKGSKTLDKPLLEGL
jgi:hypothetical protein